MKVCTSFKHSITWGETEMPGIGLFMVLCWELVRTHLFVQEWNPGPGSFPDLFENLGKSFIMSVFWNYSLASKACSVNKWTSICKSCLNFSDERHTGVIVVKGEDADSNNNGDTRVLDLCSIISLRSFECLPRSIYS